MRRGALALVGIVLAIGSVGAYETGSIAFVQAVVQVIVCLVAAGVFLME